MVYNFHSSELMKQDVFLGSVDSVPVDFFCELVYTKNYKRILSKEEVSD